MALQLLRWAQVCCCSNIAIGPAPLILIYWWCFVDGPVRRLVYWAWSLLLAPDWGSHSLLSHVSDNMMYLCWPHDFQQNMNSSDVHYGHRGAAPHQMVLVIMWHTAHKSWSRSCARSFMKFLQPLTKKKKNCNIVYNMQCPANTEWCEPQPTSICRYRKHNCCKHTKILIHFKRKGFAMIVEKILKFWYFTSRCAKIMR